MVALNFTRRAVNLNVGVPLATDDEAVAGTNAAKAITPKALDAALDARVGTGSGDIAALQADVNERALASTPITRGGLLTGTGETLGEALTFTVTAATEAQAQEGTATTVAMTPKRTEQFFGYRTTSFSRTFLTSADSEATARTAIGAAAQSTALVGAGLAVASGTLGSAPTITVTEASNAQAQAGTASDVVMTPRRTKTYVDQRIVEIAGQDDAAVEALDALKANVDLENVGDDVFGGKAFADARPSGPQIMRSLAYRFAEDLRYSTSGGDTVTERLQNAIDRSAAEGLYLKMPPTDLEAASTLTLDAAGVHIEGVPGRSLITAASGLTDGTSLLQTATVTGTLDTFENGPVIIEGMKFIGRDADLTTPRGMVRIGKSSRVRLTDCDFADNRYIMLAILGCKRVEIEAGEFTNWGIDAVTAEGGSALYIGAANDGTPSQWVRVRGGDYHDAEWSAIYCMAQDAEIIAPHIWDVKEAAIYTRRVDNGTGNNFQRALIQRAIIHGVTKKYIAAAGMELGSRDTIVSDNIIYDCEGPGIDITDPSQNVSVTRNKVWNTNTDVVTWPSYGQVTVRSTASTAETPADIEVTDNVVGRADVTPVALKGVAVMSLNAALLNRVRVQNNNVQYAAADTADNLSIDPDGIGSGWVVKDNIGTPDARPKIGTTQLSAATGAVAITGVGFRPSYVEIEAVVSSSTAASRSSGARARNSDGAMAMFSHASTSFRGGEHNGSIINLVSAAGTVVFRASLSSFDADGFTLNVTTGDTSPIIHYRCHP